MADWYVYRHDGEHAGPWSTEHIAEGILRGDLPHDVWVAPPAGPKWLRALDVPVIRALVSGLPTTPRRRDSGLRLVPGGIAEPLLPDDETKASAQPSRPPPPETAGSEESEIHTARPRVHDTLDSADFREECPATERSLSPPPPPSSPTPSSPAPVYRGGDTLASRTAPASKKRKNG